MPSACRAVWSCWRPGRNVASSRVRPASSQTLVNLMVFIFFFPDTNARRPGRCAGGRRTRISLPSIRSVIPQAPPSLRHQHVGQGAQPLALGGGIPPAGQQRPDLPDSAGHRAAVHAVHHRQRGVRDLQPQHRQRDQHPAGEHQFMAPAGALRAAALLAAAAAQVRLPARLPRAGQLSHEPAQVMTGDTGEGRMTQGRTSP